jgi:NADH-quinone oxidoreductase subunit E
MHIPLVQIFRIATFYNALSLKPRGRHKVDVCLGTACHVRGGNKILEKMERDLGISVGETTKDKRFTLESVHCVGCCSLGPVAVVDGNVFGRLSQEKVPTLLKEFE